MKLSVVIPTYRGTDRLPALLERLNEYLDDSDYRESEILLVDDGSGDAEWRKLCSILSSTSRARALRLAENRGQQIATLCGMASACGDLIITMDDDLEHRPEEIELLLQKGKEGFDLVYGVRPIRYASLLRKAGANLRDLLFRSVVGVPSGVRLSSFRLFSRGLVDTILTGPCPYAYISALAFQHAPRAASVALPPQKRREGRQKTGRLVRTLLGIFLAYSAPRKTPHPPLRLPRPAETAGTGASAGEKGYRGRVS